MWYSFTFIVNIGKDKKPHDGALSGTYNVSEWHMFQNVHQLCYFGNQNFLAY